MPEIMIDPWRCLGEVVWPLAAFACLAGLIYVLAKEALRGR